jgi:hypothetical protein
VRSLLPQETLERRLLVGGLEAVRQIGGDALVQVLLAQAGELSFPDSPESERVTLDEYLRYRDSALELLQDSFCATALETGRILARSLISENEPQLRALAAQFEHAPNVLPLIGQAAVLGARGNPGVVRASMRGPDLLVITIERCPECRNLKREQSFCFLNQGLMAELAESYLRVRIQTEEPKCAAVGAKVCEIHVTLEGAAG